MADAPSDNVHWRDSARRPRFYFMDAYACFPLMFFTLYIRRSSFLLAVTSTIFFAVLERFGFTVPVFLLWARNIISGPQKPASPWWETRVKD